jgi:transcriptional regulator with XRE-family HTH domain
MIFDRIKELREGTGMSARKFAESIGIKYTTYYGYETGTREPGSDTVTALCNYFGCTADYLLGLSNDPNGHRPEKEKAPAPAKAETGEITREMSIELLKALGLLDQSGNLSDDDLAFLAHIVGLLEWRFGDHS